MPESQRLWAYCGDGGDDGPDGRRLAEQIGISQSKLSRIEKGTAGPRSRRPPMGDASSATDDQLAELLSSPKPPYTEADADRRPSRATTMCTPTCTG